MRLKIDSDIKKEEVLVRCLLHPLWAKKGKMSYNALLPPSGKRDVSLLRLKYTSLRFCKQHAKRINIKNTKYWGLGAFQSKQIDILNKKKEEIGVSANLVSTPLGNDYKPVNDQQVYTNTPGLPMHADLLYDRPVVKGEPSNSHRKYARELLKVAQFKEDKSPDANEWMEEDFIFTE